MPRVSARRRARLLSQNQTEHRHRSLAPAQDFAMLAKSFGSYGPARKLSPPPVVELPQILCEGRVERGGGVVPLPLRHRPTRRVRGANDSLQCFFGKSNRTLITRSRVSLFIVPPEPLPEPAAGFGQREWVRINADKPGSGQVSDAVLELISRDCGHVDEGGRVENFRQPITPFREAGGDGGKDPSVCVGVVGGHDLVAESPLEKGRERCYLVERRRIALAEER